MTWNRRERILAMTAGGLAVFMLLGVLLFGGDSHSTTQLRTMEASLRGEVAKKQAAVVEALREVKQLAEWRKRALPPNPALAQSLYQTWLRELAGRCNFQKLTIVASENQSRRKAYTSIGFTLNGQASLGDVVQFLYGFYSAGHLHQIHSLDLSPAKNSTDLEVKMIIQALSLPGATRKDRLTEEPGQGLKLANLDDYRGPITKRDLFKPFREDRPVADNSLDLARYVFVTGFTEVNGARQVWIQDRTAGKLWTLSEGGEFQVGRLHGTVRTILPEREVIVDFDGRGRRLRSGDNLRGGVVIHEPEKADGQDSGEEGAANKSDGKGGIEAGPPKADQEQEKAVGVLNVRSTGQAAQALLRHAEAP